LEASGRAFISPWLTSMRRRSRTWLRGLRWRSLRRSRATVRSPPPNRVSDRACVSARLRVNTEAFAPIMVPAVPVTTTKRHRGSCKRRSTAPGYPRPSREHVLHRRARRCGGLRATSGMRPDRPACAGRQSQQVSPRRFYSIQARSRYPRWQRDRVCRKDVGRAGEPRRSASRGLNADPGGLALISGDTRWTCLRGVRGAAI